MLDSNLIKEKFLNNQIKSINAKLSNHIDMPLSDIFIFNDIDLVIKIYKYKNDFFDSEKEYFDFIQEDFNFNYNTSPDIYLDLAEVDIKNDEVVFLRSFKDKKEFNTDKNIIIIMKKINTDNSLINLFLKKDINLNEFFLMGQGLAQIKASFKKDKYIDEQYSSAYLKYMNDLNLKLERIPKGFLGGIIRYLKTYLYKNKKDFLSLRVGQYTPSLDLNLGNLIFEDSKLFIYDSFPIRKEWRYYPKEFNYFWLASDIYFLFGEDAYNKFLEGVLSKVKINLKHQDFYLLFFALISYPYFYYLGSYNKKYKTLVWRFQRNLRKFFKKKIEEKIN